MPDPRVLAVGRDEFHRFSKPQAHHITLVEGFGVLGDAHAGTLVQHRSRQRRDPNQINLRQVHLLHAELFAELAEYGWQVGPGDLGENITTVDVALLDLPTGTRLHFDETVIRLTGLRNPCRQINEFQPGMLKAVLIQQGATVIRKAGVMAVVEHGGDVHAGQRIEIELPSGYAEPLQPV